MSLQWYPGHMTKARRELAALVPSQDVVIEVLDARMPAASTNPVIGELRRDTPCVKILTRADLADPQVTTAWLRHYESATVRAFASTTRQLGETRARFGEQLAQLGLRSEPGRPVKALIAGIPNVGKSTLINTLMERAVAKVGDKPAVTKVQHKVALPSGTILTDSPGLLWPKITDEAIAMRLALGGAIPDTALDYVILGLFAVRELRARYPQLLTARFKLAALDGTDEAVLAALARRRGALLPGGRPDLHKAAELLVHEFRGGLIGRISLESPPTDSRPEASPRSTPG